MDSLNNLNGMTNVAPQITNNMMMGIMPPMSQQNSLPPASSNNPMSMSQSIFDPISSVPRLNATAPSSSANLPPPSLNTSVNAIGPISSSNTNNNTNTLTQSSGNGVTTPTTLNPGSFRPKPIEELLMPTHDKKTPSPSLVQQQQQHQQQQHPQTPTIDQKTNMGHAFKDQNLKNAWSSLSAATGSPQNTPTSAKPKPSMDSFQQFRKKAKEKADIQKLLEQQELKRSHKEAAEKRQQEQAKKRDEAER